MKLLFLFMALLSACQVSGTPTPTTSAKSTSSTKICLTSTLKVSSAAITTTSIKVKTASISNISKTTKKSSTIVSSRNTSTTQFRTTSIKKTTTKTKTATAIQTTSTTSSTAAVIQTTSTTSSTATAIQTTSTTSSTATAIQTTSTTSSTAAVIQTTSTTSSTATAIQTTSATSSTTTSSSSVKTTTTTVTPPPVSTNLASKNDSNLPYNGGPILTGRIDVRVIYLGNAKDKIGSVVQSFITNIGNSSWWNIARQYTDAQGNSVGTPVFVEQFNNASMSGSIWPMDVLSSILTNQGWVENSVYLMTLGDDMDYNGYGNESCGYHDYLSKLNNDGSIQFSVTFAVVPIAHKGCIAIFTRRNFPNSMQIDSTLSFIGHELAEAATDPFFSGYTTPLNEIGDLCNNFRGITKTDTFGGKVVEYNVLAGGQPYLIQTLYLNGKCLNGI